MTEATRRLQEEMNRMTIGVEIEMNNITRHRASVVAAEFFGTGRWEDTNYRNGYHCFSAWDQQGREWMFKYDSSINGPENQRCELVTPILHYSDIDLLQGLCRALRKAGAKSDYTRHAGVHVHVGADGHTPQSLRNLTNLVASHEALLIAALQIDEYRLNRYCKPVDPRFLKQLNKDKPKTMAELADVWYESQGENYQRNSHYNRSRYRILNLHSVFTHGTVEMRAYQFNPPADGKQNGIHCGELKAMIQLTLALNARAKLSKCASSKMVVTDNPRFTMRTWLNTLGMIGEDFETARKYLMRNLAGDCAFRYGREATRRAA